MKYSSRTAFDLFEDFLQIQEVDLELFIPETFSQISCEFYLNPRYLRGSDFLMRWSQGRWAENLVQNSFEKTQDFKVVPYGPSSLAPTDPQELESYFENLNRASSGGKRPDFLIIPKKSYKEIQEMLLRIGPSNIPFTPEKELVSLLSRSVMAVEVETSLWVASEMPDYGKGRPLKEEPELIVFKRTQKAPTLIIKEEDIQPLEKWQKNWKVPIYIFHIFYDYAYFISFDRALELIKRKIILPTRQTFQAPGGPTTSKNIYKIWYTLAKPLGKLLTPPSLIAKYIKDENGHILPYVHFSGGELELSLEIMGVLRDLAHKRSL